MTFAGVHLIVSIAQLERSLMLIQNANVIQFTHEIDLKRTFNLIYKQFAMEIARTA